MELGVFERMTLLNVLPREGDLTTIRIVRELREKLSFNDEEHALLAFDVVDAQTGVVRWRMEYGEGDTPPKGMALDVANEKLARILAGVDIDIGFKGTEIIRDRLEELNGQKLLTEAHISLCEKFEIE